MAVEPALGRMFLAGFRGIAVDADHPVVRDVLERNLGGVILFDRNVDRSRQNIVSPDQLRTLTAALQRFGDNRLLIGVDQEGGMVCRLKERDGFPSTYSAEELGRSDDPALTRERAAVLTAALQQAGVNLNLAPVVDLALNPDNPVIGRFGRSFGRDPATVVRHAGLFIDEHHRRNIGCCLKHFPGHGSSSGDTHLGFVDVSENWQEMELEPYRRLFRQGFGDAVMSAHVVNRRLDPDGNPATLSSAILSDLLRKRLGFGGVIISDDLQMRAISDHWGYEEGIRRAVLAGVDLLIVGNNLDNQEDAVGRGIAAIRSLLERGEIAVERINASLERIRLLKEKIAGRLSW